MMAPPTEFPGYFDATSFITIICAALGGYNALELILLIFTTFNVYRGLYFWSMVVATFGILPYIVGMEMMYFDPSSKLPGLIINNVGWILMVVAQSVVLYSRLGIVLGNMKSRLLSFTKWMIIVDAIIFYTLATVIVFGMHYSTNQNFDAGYIYVERLQMTGFCIQEFIISGLYIWKTLDILQAGEKKQAHRTLWQLFLINVVIVALDIALLVLEYLNLASVQIAFKALAYSVKLKLEFAILGKLVESSSIAQRNMSISFSNTIALDQDREGDVHRNGSAYEIDLAQTPSSPQFVTSALSTWELKDAEKSVREYVKKVQSHESIRTTSHQTENSEQHLPGAAQAIGRSTSRDVRSDAYHDMIRSMSKC